MQIGSARAHPPRSVLLVDPIDAAMERLREEEERQAEAHAARTAAQVRAPKRPDAARALIENFLEKAPVGSEQDLVRRAPTERRPKSGLLRRRSPINSSSPAWDITPFAKGWPILEFGREQEVVLDAGQRPEAAPEVVRHTIAVTTEASGLLAVVLPDGTAVVDGDAGVNGAMRVGDLRNRGSLLLDLVEEFPPTPERTSSRPEWYRDGPDWRQTFSEPVDTWDSHRALLDNLAEALARTLIAAGE